MFSFDALILAAGFSSRMNGFKPLYTLGDTTVLRRLVELYQTAGARQVLVVAGHKAGLVTSEARQAGARAVTNADYASGMFSSVRTGVAALKPGAHAFFVHPVDIPLVRAASIDSIRNAFQEHAPAVAHPVFLGQRGHPPLLATELGPGILTWPGDQGLMGFLERQETKRATIIEVPVADAGVLLDMDTEEDYARVSECWQTWDIPSREECDALLQITGTPERTVEHGQAVARVAVALAEGLNQTRGEADPLDLDRIERAALLHDLAKGQHRHEEVGAALISDAGFAAIAQEVAGHRDRAPGESLTEADVVFMADKLVAGTELVPVAERYGRVLERHGHDPEARAAIEGRLANARAMQMAMEKRLGEDLESVAAEALNAMPKQP